MACSNKKKKGVLKKMLKKDGKGGPIGDALKNVAGKVSDTVKKVGDTKIKDAVSGVAKASAMVTPFGAAGLAAKRGIEWAKTRGQKRGLLRGMVQKQLPKRPDLPQRAPATLPKQEVRDGDTDYQKDHFVPQHLGGKDRAGMHSKPVKPLPPLQKMAPLPPRPKIQPISPTKPAPVTPRRKLV